MPSSTIELPVVKDKGNPLFEEEAQRIIKGFTFAATGGGLIPNPIAAISACVSTQVLMIRELCYLYDVPFDQKVINVVLNSIAGSVLANLISSTISSFLSGNSPQTGLDLSGAGISAIYTATVGEFYKVHFQEGGTLDDASITDLGSYFLDEIQRKDISMGSVTNPVSTIKDLFIS